MKRTSTKKKTIENTKKRRGSIHQESHQRKGEHQDKTNTRKRTIMNTRKRGGVQFITNKMNNTKKRTNTKESGGFDSSRTTPKKGTTSREAQKHQEGSTSGKGPSQTPKKREGGGRRVV
jgi:hypothetical protein